MHQTSQRVDVVTCITIFVSVTSARRRAAQQARSGQPRELVESASYVPIRRLPRCRCLPPRCRQYRCLCTFAVVFLDVDNRDTSHQRFALERERPLFSTLVFDHRTFGNKSSWLVFLQNSAERAQVADRLLPSHYCMTVRVTSR